jgi:O-antigen/teichoic acid export membrane protein
MKKNRSFVASSTLYAASDIIFIATSGFLLLPLYTRNLNQDEFGQYILIKTAIDFMAIVLQFGLISAASRLYFDYQKEGKEREYMGNIIALFSTILAAALVISLLAGDIIWTAFLPKIPKYPYMEWCLLIAALSFFSALGTTWLRLDLQASTFSIIQLISTITLACLAFLNLTIFNLGINGILLATAISLIIGSIPLAAKFQRYWPIKINAKVTKETLIYATPAAFGVLSYFILNRINIITLQRYVSIGEIGIFGLAQQISTLLLVISTAFGKAMQPIIWSAETREASKLVSRFSKLLISIMLTCCSVVLLTSDLILNIVTPPTYQDNSNITIILILATFFYTITLASNTVFVYQKRPGISALLMLASGAISTITGLLIIPSLGALGAAISMLSSFAILMIASYTISYRIGGPKYHKTFIFAIIISTIATSLTHYIQQINSITTSSIIKLLTMSVIITISFIIYKNSSDKEA